MITCQLFISVLFQITVFVLLSYIHINLRPLTFNYNRIKKIVLTLMLLMHTTDTVNKSLNYFLNMKLIVMLFKSVFTDLQHIIRSCVCVFILQVKYVVF